LAFGISGAGRYIRPVPDQPHQIVYAIIPARYASTRFPGKPLARETGKYLIQHVYERAALARRINHVIVATDDPRIADAVASFGGRAVMTRADHPSGTDRIAEVARGLPADNGPPPLLLTIQGDEPEIEPPVLDELIARMQAEPEIPMGTLACAFPAGVDPRSPHCVKVVLNARSHALYFSRSVIPYVSEDARVANAAWLLHLGVYAYRRDFLLQFAAWPPSPLEKLERLEQLRALEHGCPITVVRVEPRQPRNRHAR
jgi:3-deoxy-manno-octulosonate cytidylyltransferase (CMP-KDO synthetase)